MARKKAALKGIGPARFEGVDVTVAFLLAGNATVTLRSGKTGTRYTYKVRMSEDGKVHFVSVMYGADNEADFTYMGIIRDGEFRWTKKSRVGADDVRVVAFAWAWGWMSSGGMPAQLEVWHEGRCGRCGRKLTVPESIASGFGPECLGKVGWVAEEVE